MFGSWTIQMDEWLGLIQWTIALAMPVFWLWYYRQFLFKFVRFMTTYLGVTVVMVLLYLMVYGLVGSDLGIPYLFWHDDFLARTVSSAGATMLLALLGMIAYYLDPYPWSTSRKVGKFLEADELIKERFAARRRGQRSEAAAPAAGSRQSTRKLHWWDTLVFLMNALIDPVGITRFQSWLEPDQENALMMQRFLRAARGPFSPHAAGAGDPA